MRKQTVGILLAVMGVVLFSGCAALVVGGAAAGAGTGTYFYINGEMKTDYYASFDAVWAACEKTVADMRGLDVQRDKTLANGTIDAAIDNEQVKIIVTYKAKNVTTVSIRIGLFGNKLSSQLIHDRILDNLAKK
ncbi:MAG: DUF3568 family protein [Syntrophales bacterium]